MWFSSLCHFFLRSKHIKPSHSCLLFLLVNGSFLCPAIFVKMFKLEGVSFWKTFICFSLMLCVALEMGYVNNARLIVAPRSYKTKIQYFLLGNGEVIFTRKIWATITYPWTSSARFSNSQLSIELIPKRQLRKNEL